MSTLTVKIPIIGPKGVGKTVFTNAITDYSYDIPFDYKPTAGVRIMTKEKILDSDFKRERQLTSTKYSAIDMEFWDTAGSKKSVSKAVLRNVGLQLPKKLLSSC